jgi:hypothetical protein
VIRILFAGAVPLFVLIAVGATFAERLILTAVMLGLAVAYVAHAIRKWLRDDRAKKQPRLLEKPPIGCARKARAAPCRKRWWRTAC